MATDDADLINALVAELSAMLEARDASVAQGLVALGITTARLIHGVGQTCGADAGAHAQWLAGSSVQTALADIRRSQRAPIRH